VSFRPCKSARIAISTIAWGAISVAAPAAPAEALVEQGGQGNTAQVEQIQASGRAGILQNGHHLHAHTLQLAGVQSTVTIAQGGGFNHASTHQVGGGGDRIEVSQEGFGNAAHGAQLQVGVGASGNALAITQRGDHSLATVLQVMSMGASAHVMQSPLAYLDTAHVLQSAVAPAAAIAQGVTGISAASSGAAGAVQALRSGQATASPSDFSHATLTQLGGAGLIAVIVQAGSGQQASIAQNGSHLEAAIVQSGAGHVASISQAGAGAPGSPYQALLTQSGNQPQGLDVHQLGGSSPRVIQVNQQ